VNRQVRDRPRGKLDHAVDLVIGPWMVALGDAPIQARDARSNRSLERFRFMLDVVPASTEVDPDPHIVSL
jgi:hypothetical protein